MRTLAALLFTCSLIPLYSCGDSCEWGTDCSVYSSNGQTVQMHGTVEFTDDDRDVKSLSPGGFVVIREGNWFNPERLYEVRADAGGTLSRTYTVDGERRQMNSAAQAWVAGAMLRLIRDSAIGAPARVQRILRSGGPNAVLAEIGEIGSDSSKRIYLRELIEHGRLNDDQLRDAMRSARRIGSDGDKADLLIEVSEICLHGDVREAWFSTAGTIGSDGDRRHVLEHAIRQDGDSGETLALAARAAGSIGSDGDKAAVLGEIAKDFKPEARQAWFRAAGSIGSDGDRAHALTVLLRTAHTQPDTMTDLLQCAAGIGSDGDKASVLKDAAQYPLTDPAVQHAFFSAVNTIGSDGDRSATLSAVLQGGNASSGMLAGIADSARHMGSDGDKAALLSRVADARVDDAAVRPAFFAAVGSIGSDGDRASVLRHVLRQPGVSPETVVAAIETVASIGSDGDKADVLLLAADVHGGNAAVRAALQKALESIHSDGDYRRVSSALIRRS